MKRNAKTIEEMDPLNNIGLNYNDRPDKSDT